MITIQIELPEAEAKEVAKALIRLYDSELANSSDERLDAVLSTAESIARELKVKTELFLEQTAQQYFMELERRKAQATLHGQRRLNFRKEGA